LLLPLGSASAPSLAFDANTGLYSPGADQVAISTNGAGRLFVDASGNVSVGSSSSISAAFTVVSQSNAEAINIRGRSADSIGEINFWSNDEATRYAKISARSTFVEFRGPDSGSIQFNKFDGTHSAIIDSSGRLGLGTSSPTHNLTIGHSLPQDYVLALRGGVGGFLGWDDSANCTILQAPNTRSLQFRVNSDTFSAGTMAMHINSSGNVGVGTTSPSQPIEVVTATGGGIAIRPSASNATQGLLWYDTGSGPWGFVKYDHQASALSFGTVNNERARIDSSGRLGLGTSSPSAKLHIDNAGGTLLSDLVLIKGGGGSGSGNLLSIQSNSADQLFAVNGLSYNVTMCSAGGRVGIGTTSPEHNLHVKDSSDGAVKIGGSNSTTGLTISYSNGGSTRTDIHQIYRSTSAAALMNIDTGTFTVSTGTAGQEKLRVDSSGRLLVGTSSESGNAKHVVRGNTGSATGAGVLDIGLGTTRPGSAGTALGYLRFTSTSNTASNYHYAAIHAETDGTSSSDTDIPGRLVFSTNAGSPDTSPTERMRINSDGTVLIATQTVSIDDAGHEFRASSFAAHTVSGGVCLRLNRLANDGALVEFFQDTVVEGDISVSGSTVSLNGAHLSRWSQLPGGATREEILRGTVLSNIDEMCEWGEEDNEQLNRMKVSDVEGDKNVSGVFQAWDDNDDTYTNDFYCAMTGDFVIRIAQGVTVERGDLLMSAGDGTAKPQDDDIIRSKTIAKVTSTYVSETYTDGSYCVPCVLMAC